MACWGELEGRRGFLGGAVGSRPWGGWVCVTRTGTTRPWLCSVGPPEELGRELLAVWMARCSWPALAERREDYGLPPLPTHPSGP